MRLPQIILAATLLVASMAVGQVNTLPVRTIDEQRYHYYEVKAKETIYSLCRQFGVDRAYIERYNPSVADGLKAGQILYFPVDDNAERAIHTVAEKETLYGISRRYNVTVDQLKEWNPETRDGIRPGQKLYVSAPKSEAETVATVAEEPGVVTTVAEEPEVVTTVAEEPKRQPIEASTMPINPPVENLTENATPTTGKTYRVGKHETFYSIAHANGITVEELEKANPTVGILQEGMVLNIPDKTQPEVAAATPQVAVVTNEEEALSEDDPTAGMITETPAEEVNIALMLPLMLHDAERAKQAQLYTEFYQGFLLAVDSMRNCGTPIHLQVYDTESSADRVTSILATPELQEVDVIVAPDSEAHLTMIGNWGAENDVDVLNLFVVKDNSYITNPNVLQGNIPHTDMYRKAINGLNGRFSRYMPVILQRNEGPDDKTEFIAALRNSLDANSIEYKVIEFENTLKESDLAELPTDGLFAFIPASGRQAELNRIAPTLIEWSHTLLDPDPIRLFGYPEWTTFRGETLVNMHKLNSIVYSRFYTVPDDPLVRRVEDNFKRWYGTEMSNFVPRQGLFGFDTGMFLINALTHPQDDGFKEYDGVQNGFNFVKSGNSRGWVNDELYFINFRPSGLIDKITL